MPATTLAALGTGTSGLTTHRSGAEIIAKPWGLHDLVHRAEMSPCSCTNHRFVVSAARFVNSEPVGHPSGHGCFCSWDRSGLALATVNFVGTYTGGWAGPRSALPP